LDAMVRRKIEKRQKNFVMKSKKNVDIVSW
jgi:hypothetical protein